MLKIHLDLLRHKGALRYTTAAGSPAGDHRRGLVNYPSTT